MKLQVSKWGNSLAVRLPAEYARIAGLKDGDTVEARMTSIGEIALTPENSFDKMAFMSRLATLHDAMPMTESVVERMRREARY